MATVLKTIIKKIIVAIATDPSKIFKFIFYFIIIPILAILLIFALPIILILSLPMLLINNSSSDVSQEQLSIIALYQDVPIEYENSCRKWIEDEKEKKGEECEEIEEIEVNFDYTLTWQDLMAIDSVKLEQDFSKSNRTDIIKMAKNFISLSSEIKTVEKEIIYQEKVVYYEQQIDKNGNFYEKKIEQLEDRKKIVKQKKLIIDVKTKSFYQMTNEIFDEQFDINLAENIYKTIIGYDVEGNFNIYDDLDLSNLQEYSIGNENIPYFNQTDKRWAKHNYGKSTIYASGCGPTSLAMVISGLIEDLNINPKVIADWSDANGYRAEGKGSYWSLMPAGGNHYGLTVEAVSRKNKNKVLEGLYNGNPIIVSMGSGHFTKLGHFIVLRGISPSGKILVYDPASVERSKKEWDIDIIMNESSQNGGINGSPFWIFSK